MNRIKQLFQKKQSNILNVYFTAGYPNLTDTETIILSLEREGADLIEIGMPYSDPLADGPTIQESGTKAIANGMNIALLFEQIKALRTKTEIPLVMMGYFNQVMQYGVEKFFQKAAEVGVDGLILPDLPLYEYEHFYKEMLAKTGLTISFLITPQTSEERIRKVDELTEGFIYMVSSAAITGGKGGISPEQVTYFERVNALQLRNPRLIGFGISDKKSFDTACQYADGAIIGSAFIRALDKEGTTEEKVAHFIKGIKEGNLTII